MRLGGPDLGPCSNPDEWVAALKKRGYSAAYCPVKADADAKTIEAYAAAAETADIVIAEVGAWWANPISPDQTKRKDGIAFCQKQLALADAIGARCCVNISGSRGEGWAEPHPDNLTEETFQLIVESVREIIDGVNPTRTYYAVETMPTMYPDTPESYARLLKEVDRERCAAHMDPVNLISSPQRYYDNASVIRKCFELFGPQIVSAHAKDTLLAKRLTICIDEAPVGQGVLDYATYLRELDKLDPDTPLMLEHMQPEEYPPAADYIRRIADELGVVIR